MQKVYIRKRAHSGSAWSLTKSEFKTENSNEADSSPSTDSETDKGLAILIPQIKSSLSKNDLIHVKKRFLGTSWSDRISNLASKKIYFADEIISKNSHELTESELVEIRSYQEIFYWGQRAVKLEKDYFDSEGYYRGIIGDHLAYRYEILSVLGSGTFSIVFECKDHKSNKLYAIKVLRNKTEFRTSGELEIRILSNLKQSKNPHKGINSIYDHFEFRGHLCIVLEKLNQSIVDFQASFPNRKVPINIVRDITAQLIRSINFMHNMKLVHCDLKPDNIMFKSDRSHEIEIIDFNSACELARKTADYVQSRPYRAPEVVLDIEYNEKIDMWSIGCIILEMILGYRVFETDNEVDLFVKFIEVCGMPNRRFVAKGRRANIFVNRLGKFKVKAIPKVSEVKILLDGFDDDLVDFVDKLIRIDPDERMSSVDALKHKWIEGKGIFE